MAHTFPGVSRQRLYRLVDQSGSPHPVLDEVYESMEAAWEVAQHWWHEELGAGHGPVEVGVEVSTGSGDWRTLRYPGS